MKITTVFLILALIIVSAGFSGCVAGGLPGFAKTTVPTPRVTTTVVVDVPEITPASTDFPVLPTATAAEVPSATIPPVTTTPTLASSSDIRELFDDVAYSYTYRLERLHYDPDNPRIVISATAANDQDIAVIERTAKDFNSASPTVKLSENVKETGTGDLLIKFVPENGLKDISLIDAPESGEFTESLTRGELYQGSVLAAKIVRGTIYINANLKGAARDHVLVRCLMYEMGLTGETTKFSDSVFYAGENTNAVLTSADKKVITMLYSRGYY
jgi:hypothetical protein